MNTLAKFVSGPSPTGRRVRMLGGIFRKGVLTTKGKEIRYSPETRLSFTLAYSVQM